MHSGAYRKFKKELGQANHFLITIMIGLDAVADGAQKREGFQATWNPQNLTASVVRSRHYAIKSALAWAVDSLDMYLRLCNRAPYLYREPERLEIAQTKHSVYKKVGVVLANHPEIPDSQSAYVDLLICWRNNLVHFDAENQVMDVSRRYFREMPPDDPVIRRYHLNVSDMLAHFRQSLCPTFKEIATLISMTIHFAESLDGILLREIDQYQFLRQHLWQLLQQNEKNAVVFSRRNTTPEIRQKRLRQLFATEGISPDFYNADGERFIRDTSLLTEALFRTQAISADG